MTLPPPHFFLSVVELCTPMTNPASGGVLG